MVSQKIPSIVPSLSYNVDYRCDMKCQYCPEYHEDNQESDGLLSIDIVKSILSAAIDSGISVIRLSGGEPLLRPQHVIDVGSFVKNLNRANVQVRLNTNGSRLSDYAVKLKDAGINVLKISLDTLDPEKFKEITGKDLLHKVLDGLEISLMLKMHVELNMVYTIQNKNDVMDILDFCVSKGIRTLKVLDLLEYDPVYWRKNYANPTELIDLLAARFGNPIPEHLSSGRGVRMLRFRVNDNTSLLLKDTHQGTTYSKVFCKDCPFFPCQDGFFSLSLNSDGKLKPCRLRVEKYYGLPMLNNDHVDTKHLVGLFQEIINENYQDVFFSNGWHTTKGKE